MALQNKILFYLASFFGLISGTSVLAQGACTICVVTVGAGLGLARWLKIDDSITGLWVAALLVALNGWTINFFKKRKWNFKYMDIIISIVFYVTTIAPLYFAGIIGNEEHRIWGIDKLIFGISIGSLAFVFSLWLDKYLRIKNNSKAYFPYQKVIIPVGALLIASFKIYFLIKWL